MTYQSDLLGNVLDPLFISITYFTACPAGQEPDPTGDTDCTACPEGTYSAETSSNNCTACPPGYSTAATAATSDAECSEYNPVKNYG